MTLETNMIQCTSYFPHNMLILSETSTKLVEVYLYICQCFSFFSDYPLVIKRQSKIPNL